MDGSRWVFSAMEHACRMLRPEDDVVLLTACPRPGDGYLECGRMILEAGEQTCARIVPGLKVRTCLVVGDLPGAALQAAQEEGADVLILGAVGRLGLRYGPALDPTTRAIWTGMGRPILLGSPRGVEVLAGEESLLVAGPPHREATGSLLGSAPSPLLPASPLSR
jgi:hypothetical protein